MLAAARQAVPCNRNEFFPQAVKLSRGCPDFHETDEMTATSLFHKSPAVLLAKISD
jgi:hypothetical protein